MKKPVFLWFGFTSLLFTLPAAAEDLPELAARRARAMTAGLEGRKLPILQRLPGPGRHAVRPRLVANLEHTLGRARVDVGDAVSEDRSEVSFVRSGVGRRWFLQVRGDGTAAAFVDEDAMQRGRSLSATKSMRMTRVELEQRGRDFIASTLRDQVVLGAGETLEPLATRHLVEDGVREEDGEPRADGTPRVLASRIIFGRQVDGTPVIGHGSWVSVTFTNDGTAAEFEYNWPRYARTDKERITLPLDAVLERAAGLSRVSLDDPGVRLRSMECGYYDSASPGSTIQPACSLSYSHQKGAGAAVYEDVIPITPEVDEDPRWPQSIGLRQLGRTRAHSLPVSTLRGLLRDAASRLDRKQ